MDRRDFLKVSGALGGLSLLPWRGAQAAIEGWRGYEVTTRVEILKPVGVSRAWIPLPSIDDGQWQKALGNAWSGNATRAQVVNDGKYGVQMLYAEWAAGTPKPMVPRPPEEIMERGWDQRMNWAAHIWCWPTPVAKIALPWVTLLIASMMAWGLVLGVSSR